ncbi:MAG: RNase adapter RapZ, partial [Bacteroidota bacterium]
SKHFHELGLNVPEVYADDPANHIYLIQDLGDETLFSFLSRLRGNDCFPDEAVEMYKKAIRQLPKFQVIASAGLDYSVCYPRRSFDRQSMIWDLSYFKYYFLKLARIPFDEQLLEDDFQRFVNFLLEADCNYYLYRDFQSRNIMICDGEPYFIDYQGGRQGALQYDVASLLFDAKADIPNDVRSILLEYYLDVLAEILKVNKKQFRNYYYGYVLIRIMQAMGAYGFRGFYEKKTHFLLSIPFALENLKWILNNVTLPIQIPSLLNVLDQVVHSRKLQNIAGKSTGENPALKVLINSFSYRKDIPADVTGHGQGFVFDCRALPNPGKLDEYKHNSGLDTIVKNFMLREEEVGDFLVSVFAIIDASVEKYIRRDFKFLSVNFGCTGGQHRSVYCAEALAKHLREKFRISVEIHHTEQKNWVLVAE